MIMQRSLQLCHWRPAAQDPAVPKHPCCARSSRLKVHTASSAVQAGSHKRLFIWGLGYTAAGLARQAQEHGWSVTSTARRQSDTRSQTHNVLHYDPGGGTELSEEGVELLQQATHVVTTIPPIAARLYDPVLRSQLRLAKQLSSAGSKSGDQGCLRWLGVLSSTSAYGDWQGDWVDERTPPQPGSAKGMLRLEHERAWMALHAEQGLPVHVFRLGGIYGPGRSVLDAMTKGSLSPSQQRRGQQKYTSRCHVADICAALLASMAAPAPGSVYNVVDDDPAPKAHVVHFAQQLIGGCSRAGNGDGSSRASSSDYEEQAAAAVPPKAAPASAATGSGRSAVRMEEKRVRNNKLKKELLPALLFPSYREGLAAIHAGDMQPFGACDLEMLGYGRQAGT